MFFVYCGYSSPDNCDSSERPTYEIKEFKTEEDVIKFKKEFDEWISNECSNIIFRVFEGTEKKIKPVKIITEWKLD
jgi:hypothetical protein